DWPGNVRELENVMRRLIVFRDSARVMQDILSKSRHRISTSVPAPKQETITQPAFQDLFVAKRQAETDAIFSALQATHWNRKQAAALLNLDYKALLYKMKKLGIANRAAASAAGR